MNNNQNRWSKEAASLCAEISYEDGIDPRYLHRGSSRNKTSAKNLQLSKEAERIISLVFAGEVHNPLLQDLVVLSVQPEGKGQQLRVSIGHYNNAIISDSEQVIAALKGIQGLLRSALAQSIHRKHVPLLHFQYLGIMDKEDC